jgi:hypothetical protein
MMCQKTPTEKMLQKLPNEARREAERNPAIQYTIKAEKKLLRMGYKLYTYDELPRDIKDKLSGGPDICAEKDGEWVFGEISITTPPHIGNYLRAGKVILILPIETSRNVEVWGEEELK